MTKPSTQALMGYLKILCSRSSLVGMLLEAFFKADVIILVIAGDIVGVSMAATISLGISCSNPSLLLDPFIRTSSCMAIFGPRAPSSHFLIL